MDNPITLKKALELLRARYPDNTVNTATLKRACRKGSMFGAVKNKGDFLDYWTVTERYLYDWYETAYNPDKRHKHKITPIF